MKVGVVGCGYLGAVHAVCMAHLGHDVVGLDVDARKIDQLNQGVAPFHEPEFEDLLRATLGDGQLAFTIEPEALAERDVVFICVGTPQKRGEHAADLSHVHGSFDALRPHLKTGALVVGKSTVPVGTAEHLSALLAESNPDAHLAWNPEFLREGFAVKDTLQPDRIVYGVLEGDTVAAGRLDDVYASQLAAATPRIVTDLATAQLVKVAANSFLATKISFINAMAELCEATGADVRQLADAIGHDDRIGRKFLNAGLGFGGGCLPKDIRAFMARAGELGADQTLSFLREVDAINMRRRVRMVDLARQECNGSIVGRRITILGAAFKPNSDDIRDSPSLNVAQQMLLQGADVTVTDPVAIDNARDRYPELRYAKTVDEAVEGADLVLLLTEWQEYRELDPRALGKLVGQRRILDGRNVLDPQGWRDAGWTYRALGRR